MALLPVDTRLKIEQLIEDKMVRQEFRPYLGGSALGKTCERELWYGFRLCFREKFTPRQARLFQRGHNEEPIIQIDLRDIGVIHHSDQKEVTFAWGHGKGHIDDILENVPDAPKTPHLGEYKTHNDKSFKALQQKGMRTSKPVHYAQMIIYMHKLKLKRGLYVAVNKNDDTRYYERISENPEFGEELIEKAKRIIRSEGPPPKAGTPKWFECKWCNYYMICHYGDTPRRGCRTCHFGKINPGGVWRCSKYGIILGFDQQILGCEKYQIMKELK